jgi:hypothetical protein
VRFEIDTEITELTTCDCSLCVKKNALMTKVHESRFTLRAGGDALAEYRWNTNVARHFFCSRCGVYTFHRKRAQPDHYGVNVFCLDGFDPGAVPIRRTDGAAMSLVSPSARDNWTGPRQ